MVLQVPVGIEAFETRVSLAHNGHGRGMGRGEIEAYGFRIL
jgi:hypothetical protein